jgi:magnesium-transporting ATPase (P-type)
LDTNQTLKQSEVEKQISISENGGQKVELVIVGEAFNHLLEDYWLPQYLGHVRVFSRMKPLDKVKCIRLHMVNHITAMCGDGGNDAGALKAAHAGIALCGSGSSVVAHFSSAQQSLLCCVDLLREARCSLDISFAAYK